MTSSFKKFKWLQSDLQCEEEGSKYFTANDKRNKIKVTVKLFDEDATIPKKILLCLKKSPHECLLQIIEFGLVEKGISEGQMVVVMEYVDGNSLESLIKTQGSLGTDDFVSLVQCLSGGFTHLWKENIFLLNFESKSIVYSDNLTANTKVFKIINLDNAKICQDSDGNSNKEIFNIFRGIREVLMEAAIGLSLLIDDATRCSMTVKNGDCHERILSPECKLSPAIKELLIPFQQKVSENNNDITKEEFLEFCKNCIACSANATKNMNINEIRLQSEMLIRAALEKNQETCLIQSALTCLHIKNLSPHYFNLQNTLQVHNRDVVSESTSCIHMISQLLHNNYSDALQLDQNISRKKDRLTELPIVHHPVDKLMFIYHCSDYVLRQTIAIKSAQNHIAVPFILPPIKESSEINKCAECLPWMIEKIAVTIPIPNISITSTELNSRDDSISELECQGVLFVRFGNNKLISKSQIATRLLMNDGNHPCFANRFCFPSNYRKQWTNGLIDISWYLRRGIETDDYPDNWIAINVHGCVKELSLPMIKTIADAKCLILCILVGDEYVKKKQLTYLIKTISELSIGVSAVIWMLSCDENVFRKELLKYDSLEKKSIIENFHEKLETQIVNSIRERIGRAILNSSKKFSLSNLVKELHLKNFMSLDSQLMDEMKKSVQNIIQIIPNNQSKSEYFPVQILMCEIVKLKKDLLTISQLPTINAIQDYQSQIKTKLSKLEGKAKSIQVPDVCNNFILSLTGYFNNDKARAITFITEFHHELSLRNRRVLTPIKQNLILLESQLNQNSNKKNKSEGENILKLDPLQASLTQYYWGVEDFMREMAFMNDYDMLANQNELCIKAAVEMLLNGLPLELMDGFSFHVALKWWKQIFSAISTKLKLNAKVCVICVMGVQSSGKSTMLNTMFGLNFSVSVGRCTRGIFMQLLPLDAVLAKQMNCTHLMLLDTEGLRSPEVTKSRTLNDNELATFVMAVSNLSIINVRGENMQEFIDILQIVCIAMIRMRQLKMKPACVLVHQGIDAIEAKDKLFEGRLTIRQLLDKVAQNAANVENYRLNETTQFQDIIEFDITNPEHVWYIPALWKGEVPMAIINPAYTNKLGELRESLFKRLSKCKDYFKTFDQIHKCIEDSWEAILKENFVFSFKNNLEITAYRFLEKEFSVLDWKIRNTRCKKQVDYDAEIHNSKDVLDDKFERTLRNQFIVEMEKEFLSAEEELSRIFNESEHKEYLVDHESRFKQKLKDLYAWNVADGIRCIHEYFQSKILARTFTEKSFEYENIINKEVKRYFIKNRNLSLTETKINAEFETLWTKWMEELEKKTVKKVSKGILFFEETFDKDLRNCLIQGNQIITFYFDELKNYKDAVIDLTMTEKNVKTYFDETDINFKKKFLNLLFSFWENNIKEWNDFLNDLKLTIESHLQKRLAKNIRFLNTDCTDFIQLIQSQIHKYNTEKKSYPLTSKLITQIYVYARQKSVPIFKQIEDRYQNQIDPMQKVGKLKGKYLQLFKDVFTKEEAVVRVSRSICDCIREILGCYIAKDCSRFIVNYLNTKCSSSEFPKDRITLISLLLYNVGYWMQKNEDVVKYLVDYAKNPIVKLKHFLSVLVVNICKERKKEIEENFVNEINILITKCAEAIGNISIENKQIDSRKFMEKVCESLIENVRGLEVANSFQTIIKLNQELVSISFQGSVSLQTNEIKEKCKMDVAEIKIDYFLTNDFIESAVNHVLNELPIVNGCSEKCPFCYSICQYTHTHDLKCDHTALQHIPQGIAGVGYWQTRVFVTSLCPTFVGSNIQYHDHKDDSWQYYKNYKERYPTWHIPADPSFETSLYWKWIAANFLNQLCSIYKIVECDIPDEWKNIKWDDAMQSLEKVSNLNGLAKTEVIDVSYLLSNNLFLDS